MKLKKSFTLIELLIVIAILGILAASVLVAINPGKRLRQANDAKRKSDINAIANALIGYSAIVGSYPGVQGCDSSIGGFASVAGLCPPTPPTGDWANTTPIQGQWASAIPIWRGLVVNQGFLKSIPKDPINNSTYYYVYIAEDKDDGTDDSPCVSKLCNYYWIGALLEEPADPAKPVFRCSDFLYLADGPGCKEVGPASLMQGGNSVANLPDN